MQELNYNINRNILLNFKQGIEIEGTSKTNNDQGKYFLDRFYFLMLPHHHFNFELSSFPKVVQFQ
jgi:hypothetical protein